MIPQELVVGQRVVIRKHSEHYLPKDLENSVNSGKIIMHPIHGLSVLCDDGTYIVGLNANMAHEFDIEGQEQK